MSNETHILSAVQAILTNLIPGVEVGNETSKVLTNVLFQFMNDITKNINKDDSEITAQDILDLISNTPELKRFIPNTPNH